MDAEQKFKLKQQKKKSKTQRTLNDVANIIN